MELVADCRTHSASVCRVAAVPAREPASAEPEGLGERARPVAAPAPRRVRWRTRWPPWPAPAPSETAYAFVFVILEPVSPAVAISDVREDGEQTPKFTGFRTNRRAVWPVGRVATRVRTGGPAKLRLIAGRPSGHRPDGRPAARPRGRPRFHRRGGCPGSIPRTADLRRAAESPAAAAGRRRNGPSACCR